MLLRTIRYSESVGTPQEWTLDGFTLGKKNLVVGKNASGKSRALNLISNMALNIAGLKPLPNGSASYDCTLTDGSLNYRLAFAIENGEVVTEQLWLDDRSLLDRGTGGEGHIFAAELDKTVKFQAPTSALAVASRRDAIQHPFLEPLYVWASSMRHYAFGSLLGKSHFAIFTPGGAQVDERDSDAVVALFRKASKEFPETFTAKIVADMGSLDYQVVEIGVGAPIAIRIAGAPGELLGLFVKERDLPGITDQHSMSQGMFRVLSLLIQLNYFQMKGAPATVLIDDIGEGLDFDRSCRLIDLLRSMADASNLQVVLSTNDRFVMNHVPLEEWSILQRRANHVVVKNSTNSKEIFEEFRFTGLSNFSFLEMDFINQPSDEGAE